MILHLSGYQKKQMEEHVRNYDWDKIGHKTTYVLLYLKNGFEIVGTSACVDVEDYNAEVGEYHALVDALKKLDELVGYSMQEKKHQEKIKQPSDNEFFNLNPDIDLNDFFQNADKITENILKGLTNLAQNKKGEG